jgi:arylformamidase
MRFPTLAATLLLSATAIAQTSLPPNWGTSGSAAPTGAAPTGTPAATTQNPQAPHTPTQKSPRHLTSTPVPAKAKTWLDCSAPLSPAITPVYEGNPPIQFSFTADMNKGDALDLSLYSFGSHTGTHVDAPLHFIRNGAPIDEVPLDTLAGPALVVNIDPSVIGITPADLNRTEWRGAKRILFRTRNSANSWIIDPHFHRDFTYLTPEAAQLLIDNGVELVGIDYLSIEKFGAPRAETHLLLLGHNIPIVEGLDLRDIAPGEYDFVVLPLKIMGHEAAPARAMLRPR